MTKRALLVGCNYQGKDQPELSGCVNDVFNMKKLLMTRFGFTDEHIIVMIDTDHHYPQPTGANIREELNKLVTDSRSGDVLVMHFSGHGTQLPSENGIRDDTGMDECIVATDSNLLKDNDFRAIVNKLPKGVPFTFISDSCHSGGLIDHEKEQIGNSTTTSSGINSRAFHLSSYKASKEGGCNVSKECNHPKQVEPAGQHVGSGRGASQGGSQSRRNRGLALPDYMSMLSKRAGREVPKGAIRTTLFSVFGKDASPMVHEYVGVLMKHRPEIMAKNSSLGKLLPNAAVDFVMSQEVTQATFTAHSSAAGHDDGPLLAGWKPPPENRVHGDMGILISGCQAGETSSDMSLPAPHGALSDAIQKVVLQKKGHITNQELVMEVRKLLNKDPEIKQNPGLYCSDSNAKAAFICAI